MKLSIIIPVYNVEKYIEKCLDSCFSQSYDMPHNYEIIIVNDGSTDNSLSIIQDKIKEQPNVTLLSQSNGGLSAARNKGLRMAKGEYVWFVDSDDWIAEDSLHYITKELKANVDILRIGACNVLPDKYVKRNVLSVEKNLTGRECFLRNIAQISCAPFSIYRREFLIENNLHFYEGIFHEDMDFCPRATYLASKVKFLSKILYFVRQNPTSITRSSNIKKSYDYLVVARNLLKFSDSYVNEIDIARSFYGIIGMALNNALNNLLDFDKNSQEDFCFVLKDYGNVFECMQKSSVFKYKIEGWVFDKYPLKCMQIYRILYFLTHISEK